MHRDAFGHAPHQHSIETLASMRADDNQARGPRMRRVEDADPRIARRNRLLVHDFQARCRKNAAGLVNGGYSPGSRVRQELFEQAG